MPCADAEPIIANSKVTISSQSSQHSHKDVCSPFCTCNCCGCQGFVFNTIYNYKIISIKKIIAKKVPKYKTILTFYFYGSIWQPPQI